MEEGNKNEKKNFNNLRKICKIYLKKIRNKVLRRLLESYVEAYLCHINCEITETKTFSDKFLSESKKSLIEIKNKIETIENNQDRHLLIGIFANARLQEEYQIGNQDNWRENLSKCINELCEIEKTRKDLIEIF